MIIEKVDSMDGTHRVESITGSQLPALNILSHNAIHNNINININAIIFKLQEAP